MLDCLSRFRFLSPVACVVISQCTARPSETWETRQILTASNRCRVHDKRHVPFHLIQLCSQASTKHRGALLSLFLFSLWSTKCSLPVANNSLSREWMQAFCSVTSTPSTNWSSEGREERKPGLESHSHSSRLAAVHSDRTRKRKRKRIVRGHLRTILLGLEARNRELLKLSDHRRYFVAWLSPRNARQAWYGRSTKRTAEL